MKVKIKEIVGQNNVIIANEYGSTKAVWNGSLPKMEQDYHVEIDIPFALTWGVDIQYDQNGVAAIGSENGNVVIVGNLESIEEDGFTVIRLGDSIIALETTGEPLIIGTFVRLKTAEIILFPVEYF